MKLTTILFILVFIVIILEIITKKVTCPLRPSGDITLFTEFLPNEEAKKILTELRNRRSKGESISKLEYKKVFEKVIYKVPASRMGSWFGVVPQIGVDICFIRDNLPTIVANLVKRHELEHLLQTGQEKNVEWSANVAVIKEYHWRSLFMIPFAVKDRFSFYHGEPLCLVASLWVNFKKYLLPF